jgi:hypothetical protein
MKRWQTQEDKDAYTDRRRQDASRSRSAMKNKYSRKHEQRILRERLEEQREQRVFSGLQQPENKRKLRKPHSPVNTLNAQLKRYIAVPMGLPHTSLDWTALSESEKKEEATKHKKKEEQEEHQYQDEELQTIDVVSPDHDRNDEYYFRGTELFKVKKSDALYDREDRDLAASLRRNAAAAAATVARK